MRQPDSDGDFGSILGIWAHPDDEAWLSSGLMMRAVEHGHRVGLVTATRGEKGFPDDDPRSPSERMQVREGELARCLDILGVTEHRYLGYADGGCADVPDEEPVSELTRIIADFRPDLVLCFGPDGATGHPDHIATCRWTTAAVADAGLPETRLLYATRTARWRDEFYAGVDPATVVMVEGLVPEDVSEDELALWFRCNDELLDRKVAALRAQASQIEPFIEMTGVEYFGSLVREEFFRSPREGDDEFLAEMSLIRL